MAPGFTIREVRFRGHNVEDAVISLTPGLCVIAGPSNTGKSLLRSAINFVFGSGDPMKTVDEAAPYRQIFVEVRTTSGTTVTFERAWQGGDIRQYTVPAGDVRPNTPATILAAKHSADNANNISAVLLSLAGLSGTKLLRAKTKSEIRNLSFRDLIEYVLVSEERIITELSPIHTDNFMNQTVESSLFRVLLTGKDDKDIISAPAPKDQRANAAGRGIVIERLRADVQTRLPKDGHTEADNKQAAATIDAQIAEQSKLLQNYRADLGQLERKRRDLQQEHERALARHTQISANLQRFTLLREQYTSDLERLRSNLEAGSLLGHVPEEPCPICGSAPEHHQQHSITQEELDEYSRACSAEAQKIQLRQNDLVATMAQLSSEQGTLKTTLEQLDTQRTEATKALRAVLAPNIANLDEGLTSLVERRQEIERTLAAFEELHRLDELERTLAAAPTLRGQRTMAFSGLPPDAYDNFARAVEKLLRAWSFPELDRVVFDTDAEDIALSGKARTDNGKGYRAITYAAFMIALLQETERKELPHPGFIILDSPLVTYREPEEHIGDGVKFAFYRNLASILGNAQVIILENEEPPEELKDKISFTGFTKNRTTGRYGLFPPLPVDEQA
jgi:hypothetical protein